VKERQHASHHIYTGVIMSTRPSSLPVRAAKGRQHVCHHVWTGVIMSTRPSSPPVRAAKGRQHVYHRDCTDVSTSARVSARLHGCHHVSKTQQASQLQEVGSDLEEVSGSEAGSYLRLIDSCITQLKAQGPS